MNRLIGIVLVAFAAGCATAPVERPPEKVCQASSAEPVQPQLVDPNPYASYSTGMASDSGHPMAYEWQSAHESEIAKATAPERLYGILESKLLTRELLDSVKDAYSTDPMAATQIAAITQLVMRPKCPKAAAMREKWVKTLIDEVRVGDVSNTYRTMFFLDQLRWCGRAEDAFAIRQFGGSGTRRLLGRRMSGDGTPAARSSVNDFAVQVANELEAR